MPFRKKETYKFEVTGLEYTYDHDPEIYQENLKKIDEQELANFTKYLEQQENIRKIRAQRVMELLKKKGDDRNLLLYQQQEEQRVSRFKEDIERVKRNEMYEQKRKKEEEDRLAIVRSEKTQAYIKAIDVYLEKTYAQLLVPAIRIYALKTMDNDECNFLSSVSALQGFDNTNYSTVEKEPADYPTDRKDMCIRTALGNVKLYKELYNERIQKLKIREFCPGIKEPKSTEIDCILEPATFVEILQTFTHKRTRKGEESYFYVLCKVRVTDNCCNAVEQRGKIGYVWQNFRGKKDIELVSKIPTDFSMYSAKRPHVITHRFARDFEKGVVRERGVEVVFIQDVARKREVNAIEHILTTKPILFENLIEAAVLSHIRRLKVGFLNYGGTGSHGQGKGIDLASITHEDGLIYGIHNQYHRIFNASKIIFETPIQPAAIKLFEDKFIALPGSVCVLGPWRFLYKKQDPLTNLIDTHPILGTIPSQENSQSETEYKILVLETIDKMKKDKEIVTEATSEKLHLHWQHRHHGHYSIEPIKTGKIWKQ